MLHKILRAMARQRKDVSGEGDAFNFEEAVLAQADITSIIRIGCVKVTEKGTVGMLKKFCAMIDDIKESLLAGAFDPADADTTLPRLSPGYCIDWMNEGLVFAFGHTSFTEIFFVSLEQAVMDCGKTVSTAFGDAIIPTDDSITEALSYLPRGAETVLFILQNAIWAKTVFPLFYFSMSQSLGGPGSASRLVIDMVESQLFSAQGIAEMRIFQSAADDPSDTLTYGKVLFDEILAMLGPYPVNIAYGPILQHILYLQCADGCFELLDLFLGICQGDNGLNKSDNFVWRMGLLSIIGLFILGSEEPKKTDRPGNLFCRSQIPTELVWKVLPFDRLKQVYDCLSKAEKYDDFVVIAFSQNIPLLREHGLSLVSAESMSKLQGVLATDKEGLISVLEEVFYHRLVELCNELLSE